MFWQLREQAEAKSKNKGEMSSGMKDRQEYWQGTQATNTDEQKTHRPNTQEVN